MSTLGEWLHSLYSGLSSFTPADFHWPTAVVTAILILVFYQLNTIIANNVSALLSSSASTTTTTIPSSSSSSFSPSVLLDFFLLVGRLKTIKRTGWVNHAVHLPESIADHMYRLAIMTFTFLPLPSSPSSPSPLLTALAHDLGEAMIGDITPPEVSGVSKEDKQRMERDAMQQIAHMLGGEHGELLLAAWEGYEEEKGEAAALLHDLDKLEMIVQAYEYEKEEVARRQSRAAAAPAAEEEKRGGEAGGEGGDSERQKPLDRFYESAEKLKDVRVKLVAEEVLRRRTMLFDAA